MKTNDDGETAAMRADDFPQGPTHRGASHLRESVFLCLADTMAALRTEQLIFYPLHPPHSGKKADPEASRKRAKFLTVISSYKEERTNIN